MQLTTIRPFPFDDATIARFRSNTEQAGSCLRWTGVLNRGTPQFSRRHKGQRICVQARRYAYELDHGSIPDDGTQIIVVPSCGDRLCIAAAHLELGTQADLDRWDEELLAERFWSRVDQGDPDDCWEWKGYISPTTGYGVASHRSKSIGAHVRAFVLAHGPVPRRREVCHRCGNRACCNPRHLYAGTHVENMADRQRHGRNIVAQGPDAPMAKLTAEQVREIRRRSADGETYKALAAEFGLHWQNIGRVVRREGYRNVI